MSEERPLSGYAVTLGAYAGLVATVALAARWRARALPERIGPWDVALLSVATYRLSRSLSKDQIASPLRAPFTEYQAPGSAGEPTEQARAAGRVRRAVGELLTCPFCLSQWVATGLLAGHLLIPRATRAVTATLTAVGAADFLQVAYARGTRLG